MVDNVTKEERSYIMSKVKGRNTIPELRIKKLLEALNFTYQPKDVFGRPDFANKRDKIVVFVDGCFWHGCHKHYVKPKSNVDFWERKIARNIRHDREVSKKLRDNGWKVIRIWEHELKV